MKLLLVWIDIRHNSVLNPHHGLAWIAGSMKGEGHDVKCIHIREKGELEKIEQEITKFSPTCIGFTLVTNQRQFLDSAVNICRKTFKGIIIVGGAHATLSPEDTLKCAGVDGVCIGEGEKAMINFAERVDNNQPYMDLPSFVWRNGNDTPANSLNKNNIIQFERDLSNLSYPDYSIFDINTILESGAISGYMPVLISRGCPYICTYCCNKAIKDVYEKGTGYFRMLEPEQAIDLLLYFIDTFPIKGFNFADDLFVCHVKWFSKFTKLYIEKINLPYICNARVEMLKDIEIAGMLKESGCQQVSFGIESGDEEYRRNFLKRNYKNSDIITATSLLHKVGIPFSSYNIMGFPMETGEQMEKTIEINRKMRPTSGMVFFFFPYPGTELYKICEENNLIRPEGMTEVESFMERPVIKLTNSSDKECMEKRRNLFLYFKTRKAMSLLKINNLLIENILYRIMLLSPNLFIKFGRGKYVPHLVKRWSEK